MPIEWYEKVIKHDLATADFFLQPPADKAYEVYELGFVGGGTEVVAEIKVEGRPVISLPIADSKENLAYPKRTHRREVFLFDTLKKIDAEYDSFKINQGNVFSITTGLKAGTLYLKYREYNTAMPEFEDAILTSRKPKAPFISYGKAEASIAAGATAVIQATISLNPKEYYTFPFVEKSPAGRKLTLLALGCRRGDGSGADVTLLGVRVEDEQGNIFRYGTEFAPPELFGFNTQYYADILYWLEEPRVYTPDKPLWLFAQMKNAGTASELGQAHFVLLFNDEPLT
jgi:hypothetical protein